MGYMSSQNYDLVQLIYKEYLTAQKKIHCSFAKQQN